jgi:hypothetical protein
MTLGRFSFDPKALAGTLATIAGVVVQYAPQVTPQLPASWQHGAGIVVAAAGFILAILAEKPTIQPKGNP